jgi:hypothetical protein
MLSYVWGDPRITSPISVGRCDIELTVNLESVLRHIRGPLRTRKVGVDGVCINQSNAEKKSLQVSQMGKFYSQAEHTIIYLGDETRETE